jgi:two-component system response regulator MprA
MEQAPNKQRILIVEDDLPVLNALADKLTREGFGVLQAKDGEEGLSMANLEHPDLILLDIVMPKMDGLTMMKKLRATSAWGKSVPIILLTSLTPDEERINKSIAEDEPSFYLIKTNWSMSDVVERVRESLKSSTAPTQI